MSLSHQQTSIQKILAKPLIQLLNYFFVRKNKLLGGQRPPQDPSTSLGLAQVPWEKNKVSDIGS